MFAFSTFYHSFFYHVATSQVFQILDHCGIFIFIAATYTPFALMGMSTPEDKQCVTIIFVEWGLALLGIVLFIMAFYFKPFRSVYCYIEPFVCIAMGWTCVVFYDSMLTPLPKITFDLLLYGGCLYTFGVAFLLNEAKLPFFHVIWHLFVFAAAVCHYFALVYYAPIAAERWYANNPIPRAISGGPGAGGAL